VAVGTLGCSGSQTGGGAAVRINGGGATFVDPIMQKWAGEYRRAHGTEIDYVKKGSGYGIAQMTAKTLDFGCSDAPMLKEETETAKGQGGDVVHVPITMGAVAVVYNLPELQGKEPLKLSGPVLADVYLRKVTKWNDKAIAELNPGSSCPTRTSPSCGAPTAPARRSCSSTTLPR
jgi:phosphate transport system substrate-binding protein